MATRFVTHVQTGVHGDRPAASAVPQGALFACATHNLVYQSDGSSAWSTWFTGGSVLAFGSNSNAVSDANAPGSHSSNARADHVHLGVRTVSHASNTFAGPIILTTPGNTVGISVPTPGTFALTSAAQASAGGGSGTPTDSYIGYNTIGGTAAAFAQNSYVLKAVTPATDVLLLSVEGYIALNAEGANPVVFCGVLTDNAGTAALALRNGEADPILDTINGAGGLSPRWYGPPMAPVVLTGGTQYWLQFGYSAGGNWINFYRDGSGSDKTVAASGLYGDAGFFTITGTTDRYSIRALVIAL